MRIAKLGPGILEQRILDVQEIEKKRGWKTQLTKKWGINVSSVGEYLKNHAKELGLDDD